MSVRSWRRSLSGEDGVTLVELMVSAGLLAIVLTALAGTLIVTLTSVSRTEEEVVATQFAQEIAESLQVGAFDTVALYEDEIDSSMNPDAVVWEARLDAFGDFETGELISVAGPVGTRDDSYPRPVVFETRSGIDMRVDRYLTWVDRDGDGFVETKRLTSFVTWVDRTGKDRELRFDSERVPTQDESVATNSGTRVIQFTFAPDPAELDSGDGGLQQDVAVFVRTNEGTRFGAMSLYTYDEATDDFVLFSPVVSGGEFGGAGDYVTWTATVPASTVLGNGTVDVRFEAQDVDGATVAAIATLDTYGGPFDVSTPTPGGGGSTEPPTPDPTGTPTPDPTPTVTPTPDPAGALSMSITLSPSSFCVSNNQHELGNDLTVNVTVSGATNANSTIVVMSYPYKTRKNLSTPDRTGNNTMNEVTVGASSTTYTVTVPANSVRFSPGDTVLFDIRADRDGGATSDDVATASFTASVTTC